MSAENLSYRLQRNPGSSLTWHDGRSQRPDGGHTVKLLRQPGTEGSQVPHTPPGQAEGSTALVSATPWIPCRIRSSALALPIVLMIIGHLVIVTLYIYIHKYISVSIRLCWGELSMSPHLCASPALPPASGT